MSGLFDGTKFERPVTCERCEQPLDACGCPRNADGALCLPADQPARVRREKRKGGKVVTVVSGLDASASDLPGLVKRFKQQCAAGGSVVGEEIELQGDHRETVVAGLVELGYPAKPAGG